jgi:D-beta-D-heptose 7-phosphate kinase/D-beta-D-heptose 1-phosphate adenosyltransferase
VTTFHAPDVVLRAVENGFGRRRVLVVGDLMLDAYLWGDVGRISPEAPVPVVRLKRRSGTPGGSGNVLLNLSGLGLAPVAAGFVGDDPAGRELLARLGEAGVDASAVVTLADRPTTTKTRVVCAHHQMLRLDEESTAPVGGPAEDRLIGLALEKIGAGVSAVVLSDYAKGALTEGVCRAVIEEARRRGVPVLVDPKGRSFARYAGATALTPNLAEFEAVAGFGHLQDPEFADAARRAREALGLDFLAVTCGDRGIVTFDERGLAHHPAAAREVYDVSGAGDTVIATLTAALAAGLCLDDAVTLANLAAGVVVGKLGTTPVRRGELLDAARGASLTGSAGKVVDLPGLRLLVAGWRARGERVVFTNGCFDLLHVGHVTLLARARREGDRLVVGLNTDRSVRALKGPSRPVVTQDDRAHVLAGLASVDAVALFDEDTPLRLIEEVRPDVLVKGGDYSEAQVVGAGQVRSWGGRVAIVPLVEGRSTTGIIDRSRSDQQST